MQYTMESRTELATLKEQLSEKELKVYELELRVKDLKAEVKDLSDAKDKLAIANRNARVLEEENNGLHSKLRALEGEHGAYTGTTETSEAQNLIRENSELRNTLREKQFAADKAAEEYRLKEAGIDRTIKDLSEARERLALENERQAKELESVRREFVEVQRQLDEERETARETNDLWHQEKERYIQRLEELSSGIKRAEGMRSPKKDARAPRDRGTDEPLSVMLLKEEVSELEGKLKEAQEALWRKEKEWLSSEAALKSEIAALQGTPGAEAKSDTEIYRALQSQIASLKEEITTLRGERRQSRLFNPVDFETESVYPYMESERGSSIRPSPRIAEVPNQRAAQMYSSAVQENDGLRHEIDHLKVKMIGMQSAIDEKTVRCQELEVMLAAAKKNPAGALQVGGPSYGEGKRRGEQPSATPSRTSSTLQPPADEANVLRRKVRELQTVVDAQKAAQEQKDTINSVRQKECLRQIEELLLETERLREVANNARNGGDEAGGNGTDMDSVMRLSKDKRDSVEDVMRLLEAAWAAEDEARRLLRKANYEAAAMANQDAFKDEEIRRLQKALDDMEDRLRDAQADRDALDKLRDDLRDRDDRIADLERIIRDLEKGNRDLENRARAADGDHDNYRNKLKRKENEAKDLANKIADLQRQLRDLEDDRKAANRARDNAVDDLNRRLEDTRRENDQLRRQLAAPRDSPRRDWSANARSGTPRMSTRSPRVSARVRSPELALSHLSVRSSEERKRNAVPEGAHLAVTIVELADVLRNGRPITEPGYIIIKLKSIKEKYKTSVKELASVVRFDETFVFYLAQPDQDVITLHVFYKPKSSSREYHIGDACFSMATLYRGVTRQRIAPVAQNPGTQEARRAAQVEVLLQTDDFGKMTVPTEAEVEDERLRFNELVSKLEDSAPEKLHAADVYMASMQLQ